jgi:methylglutaconyl-CoA hydratase
MSLGLIGDEQLVEYGFTVFLFSQQPRMNLVQKNIEGGVATVTLCRSEKRNALSRELLRQLSVAVNEVLADSETRVLVLKAEGKVFCAGMDLAEMQDRASSADGQNEWMQDSKDYCDLLVAIYTSKVPTIASMQGPVLAGGVGMVLACDFVVAVEDSFISLPEPQRGITAAMVTPLLVHRVGAGPAGHLLLSGRRQSAKDAATKGLVYEVTTNALLDDSVASLAKSIMQGSPEALAITRRHLDDIGGNDLVVRIRQSIEVSAQARASDDAREGLAAFLEKRQPNWQTD